MRKSSLLSTVICATALLFLVSCAHTNNEVKSADVMEPTTSQAVSNPAAETPSEKIGENDLASEETVEIPKDINDLVVKWMNYFEGKGRSHMERYLSRSARYSPLMKDILKKNGLPEDLIYLCLIESGFSSGVRSHAGAVGYWQFVRGTGKTYGLKIDSYVDERRDPVRSTQAAASYLKGLYNLFGSWYLAIAAYNVGENRVKREVMTNYTRDFWEIARRKQLPRETIDYVPKFIAARMIAKNPAKYGFDNVEYLPPFIYDEITVTQPVSLRKLARALDETYEEIKALNPSYRGESAPLNSQGTLTLRVPEGKLHLAQAEIQQAYISMKRMVATDDSWANSSTYKVRKGDTLASIARKHNVPLGTLIAHNEMSRKSVIRVGGTIRIPEKSSSNIPQRMRKSSAKASASVKSAPNSEIHVVRTGDTLTQIAKKYNVSIKSLAAANKLSARAQVNVGRKLVIPE